MDRDEVYDDGLQSLDMLSNERLLFYIRSVVLIEEISRFVVRMNNL